MTKIIKYKSQLAKTSLPNFNLKKRLLSIFVAATFIGFTGMSHAANGVIMQYFQWYTPNNGSLWTEVQQEAANLSAAGVTALWLPPAYKGGAGKNDVGYGVYDMYDLGEFNQKGSVRTKYGTKDEYLAAIDSAHENGIKIYGDVVFNHRSGADKTDRVTAVRVDWDDRNREIGADVEVDVWTSFTFPGRNNAYSTFKWTWYHFDATDRAQNLKESAIFKFRGAGKSWDWEVDTSHGNYDYLMFADLDMDHPDVVQELKDWTEWYVDFTGVDGFRVDAVKHIKYGFFENWLQAVRANTGKSLFTVGEYWSYDVGQLHNFIEKTNGVMSLFDAPLHINFYNASKSGGGYDMSTLMDNTLMKENPILAVTLVDNHDTQPCQALASAVEDWFKPMAYAFILLRKEGYPNIFHADYYGAKYTTSDNGCNKTNISIKAQKVNIDELLYARKNYAYGQQISYMDHHNIIGWTRLGDNKHPEAMAVIMNDGPSGSKWMDVDRVNKQFKDITGNNSAIITTNRDGWGKFPVKGGSYSVWVQYIPVDTDDDGINNDVDTDDDNDGVEDVDDAFPLDITESVDTDNDGTGNNADTDDDNDGVNDDNDVFPLDPTESVDTDNDGAGNNADTDDDNDGVNDDNDDNDVFPLDPTESVDTDNDGTGNNADTDDDNDGVNDDNDVFPLDLTESVDTDNDGTGNNADTDDDNDGVLDSSDYYPLDPSRSVAEVASPSAPSSGGSMSLFGLLLLVLTILPSSIITHFSPGKNSRSKD